MDRTSLKERFRTVSPSPYYRGLVCVAGFFTNCCKKPNKKRSAKKEAAEDDINSAFKQV